MTFENIINTQTHKHSLRFYYTQDCKYPNKHNKKTYNQEYKHIIKNAYNQEYTTHIQWRVKTHNQEYN